MTGDLPAAALRLMASLPVRTHERVMPAISEANHVRPVVLAGVRYESLTEAARQLRCNRETLRRRLKAGRDDLPATGRGGHNARRIIIQGVSYKSLREASEAVKVSYTTIYKWLGSGRARYAGRHE